MASSDIITAQQHILDQQQLHPSASGEFSLLLSGIVLASKMVADEVRRLGLSNVRGAAGEINVQGEVQQGLDVFANQTLIHCLGNRGIVGVLASEENEEPIVKLEDPQHGKYAVVFDPLDGSSNIDVNVSVGTIFSILKRDTQDNGAAQDSVLQPGTKQVAAGYVLYGSSTMLVFTMGDGVDGFTLDPSIGAFVLSHPQIKMPERGSSYSVNEAYADSFPPYCRRFLHWLKSGEDDRAYSLRYIGSLVADFHRTLLKGGIFMYPPTSTYPEGKLRLLYEANPIAMLAEQAGALATTGYDRVMETEPTDVHQRTPLFVGSPHEMARLHAFANKPLKV